MKKTTIVQAVVLLTAAAAMAEPPASNTQAVGELTPIACAGHRARPLSAYYSKFAKPDEGSGTVSPHAIVATLSSGSLAIKAAIDSDTPDAKAANVIRLDFSGAGKFAGKPALPLKGHGTGTATANYVFGPSTLSIQRDGRTIPVIVRGNYYKTSSSRSLYVFLGTALAGRCAFGKQVCAVRLIDGNCNLTFGEAPKVSYKGGRIAKLDLRGDLDADSVAVDTGDGTFKSGPVSSSLYGQPLLVGGVWYEVKLSPDGKKISATPTDAKSGRIRFAHRTTGAVLLGTKAVFEVNALHKPVAVPADRYVISRYHLSLESPRRDRPSPSMSAGMGKLFEVPAGETVTAPIGPPLTASVQLVPGSEGFVIEGKKAAHYDLVGGIFGGGGKIVRLDLKLVDAGGARVSSLYLPDGKRGRPAPPKVTIHDANGKEVYHCTMEYG